MQNTLQWQACLAACSDQLTTMLTKPCWHCRSCRYEAAHSKGRLSPAHSQVTAVPPWEQGLHRWARTPCVTRSQGTSFAPVSFPWPARQCLPRVLWSLNHDRNSVHFIGPFNAWHTSGLQCRVCYTLPLLPSPSLPRTILELQQGKRGGIRWTSV